MTKNTVVCNLDNERLWWTLAPTKYCVPAIPLAVINCEPKLFHWDLSGGIDLLHVTDITRWIAIPTRSIGPKHLLRDFPNVSRHRIYFMQVDNPMKILKYRFLTVKHALTHEDMTLLCQKFGFDSGGTLAQVKQRLVEYCIADDPPQYRRWYLEQLEILVDEDSNRINIFLK